MAYEAAFEFSTLFGLVRLRLGCSDMMHSDKFEKIQIQQSSANTSYRLAGMVVEEIMIWPRFVGTGPVNFFIFYSRIELGNNPKHGMKVKIERLKTRNNLGVVEARLLKHMLLQQRQNMVSYRQEQWSKLINI